MIRERSGRNLMTEISRRNVMKVRNRRHKGAGVKIWQKETEG